MKTHAPAPGFHTILRGPLGPGEVITSGSTVWFGFPISGLLRAKVRAQVDADATLHLRYPRPDTSNEFADDGSELHADVAAPDVVLPAGSEAVSDPMEFHGEGVLMIGITAGGADSTITGVWLSAI